MIFLRSNPQTLRTFFDFPLTLTLSPIGGEGKRGTQLMLKLFLEIS